MKKELTLHPIQTNILRCLVFKNKESFKNLNKDKISSDSFSFHIKSLIKSGLIKKDEAGKYYLSIAGKEFANRLDVDNKNPQIEKQAKIGVLIFAIKKEKGGKKYLIQQRLKHPYFGYFGGVGGKIKIGETILQAANRELKEETGLSGKLVFCGINHKMDYDQTKNLLEDKLFFVFKALDLKGELLEDFQGGKNFWLSWEEMKKTKNLFPDVLDKIKIVEGKGDFFTEKKFFVKEF